MVEQFSVLHFPFNPSHKISFPQVGQHFGVVGLSMVMLGMLEFI